MTKFVLDASKPSKAVQARQDFDRLIEKEFAAQGTTIASVQASWDDAKQKLFSRREMLFPEQFLFVSSRAKKKAALCTRRAGKTFGLIQTVLEAVIGQGWDDPNKSRPVVQIIGTTKKAAGDLFWEPMKAVARQCGIEAVWNDHEYRADFPNGVLLRIGGANDRAALEEYRGASYTLVILDEAASFGSKMESLILSSIEMALVDYQGSIIMAGTPGETLAGYFYEITTGQRDGWECYKWSFLTNSSIPEEERTLEAIRRRYGDITSPRCRREAFGEWAADNSSLVYKWSDTNLYNGELPAGHQWRYVLGVDLGFNDPTAFSVVAHARTTPHMYEVFSHSQTHMYPSDVAEYITKLKLKYGFARIVVDTGGSMAKGFMMEWNRRLSLGLVAAEKKNKNTYIEHLNSDLNLGVVHIRPDSALMNEWRYLIWEDHSSSIRHDGAIKEHAGFANHVSDAFLYAYRESMHFRGKVPEEQPVYGTKEYWQKKEEDAKLQYLQSVRNPKFRYNQVWKK